jgi:hypothetical protein
VGTACWVRVRATIGVARWAVASADSVEIWSASCETNDRDSPFAQQRDQADDWVAAVFGSDREYIAVLLVSPEDAEAAAARFGENRRVLTPMMTAGIGRRSSS